LLGSKRVNDVNKFEGNRRVKGGDAVDSTFLHTVNNCYFRYSSFKIVKIMNIKQVAAFREHILELAHNQ